MPARGWYDDPDDPTGLRFWSGHEWTSERKPKGGAPLDLPDVSPVEPPAETKLEALAKAKLDMRLGVGREIKQLGTHLRSDEELVTMARGGYKDNVGIIVVTTQRVIFYDKKIVGEQLEDFPLSAITSIGTKTGLMSGKVEIYAGSHKTELTQVIPRERAAEIVAAVRERQAQMQSSVASPAPVPASAAAPDRLEQLERLGRLREQGVLSEQEFAVEKARLLGQ